MQDIIIKKGGRHYFHSECIEQWIKKHENCPMCRSSLTKSDIEKYFRE